MMSPPPPDETTRKSALAAGFTLIELSVVLVIIGLIVGGILVGRDLIEAATLRAVLSQQEQFKTATATFLNKYNCLSGDCLNASSLGFTGGPNGTTTAGVPANGNGDGIIGPTNGSVVVCCSPAPANESVTLG